MTQEEAKTWLRTEFDVPRETIGRLETFVALITQEAEHQNLVAASTLPDVWNRHIVDSSQLLRFAPMDGSWLDLGSGAGFPGLVLACIGMRPVTLVESRRKRIDFLQHAVRQMGIEQHATVAGGNAETIELPRHRVITARAFAPLEKLLAVGAKFAMPDSIWILPKGRSAASELEAARRSWQGSFRIEPSVTDPDSAIIVAEHVSRKGQR